jgi:hypothetical protein
MPNVTDHSLQGFVRHDWHSEENVSVTLLPEDDSSANFVSKCRRKSDAVLAFILRAIALSPAAEDVSTLALLVEHAGYFPEVRVDGGGHRGLGLH